MTIEIVDWDKQLSIASKDIKAGINIATLLDVDGTGTYITVIPPGLSVNPHYHKSGSEEYHIISGSGIIKLHPVSAINNDAPWSSIPVKSKSSFIIPPNTIHQLINNSTEPLTLIFCCPPSHLTEDRYMVEQSESSL